MRLICVGISHKTAPVELREKLAFDPDQAARAAGELKRLWPLAEFVILSTCNRTELYAARPVHGFPREEELRQWLTEYRDFHPGDLAELLYTLGGNEAIRHLFTVAGGLDSMVVGEDQIIAQLKSAYALATDAGAAGPAMNELFQSALHTAKHIRTETDIATGKASVASIAVHTLATHLADLPTRRVLALGAGQTVDTMLKGLRDLGVTSFTIANRSLDRARAATTPLAGNAVSLDELHTALLDTDIVVCSTASPEPLLMEATVRDVQSTRNHQPLFIIDIAVPRDVEDTVRDVAGVTLVNIDDLQADADATLARRRDESPKTDAIIDEHVQEMTHWLRLRSVAPTIHALKQELDAIADAELRRAGNKLATHDDVDEDMDILRLSLHRMVRRMLHPLADYLKQQARDGEAHEPAAMVRDIFRLSLDDTPTHTDDIDD
jgi:glutamyl-tRNA reductase